ncbi:S41 family peptidase [Pedobacter sp. BMA]|uniref:S41 family peptidase n=1 Tax=Pedobacter sp. BMA TaxID=1663685 RepID=UPI00064A57BF|nr:S41 family peptidase [Pedobacter sp. BMA]KLT67215.1 hypothetical protein AB669_00335 [Pedobacter sp. BMA]
MFKKYFLLILSLSFLTILSCSHQPKLTSKNDVDMLLTILKANLSQQYFDKAKAVDLVNKLTKMESQKKFDHLTPTQAARMITSFLQAETHDKHFNVTAYPANPENAEEVKPLKQSVAGISDYRILKNNIGYIKWDLCIANENAFREIRKVLNTLTGCRGLIFDLTENPGGDGASSAFFNQFLYGDKGYQTLLKKKCTGDKEWHQSEVIFNYKDGPTFFDKPIYIIASKNTFSAAEYFAFTAKEMKRAIILGDTTAGAGNPGTSQGFRTPETDTIFWMFIPNCQIETKDGHSIEGIGVAPDVLLKSDQWLQETLVYVAKHAK